MSELSSEQVYEIAMTVDVIDGGGRFDGSIHGFLIDSIMNHQEQRDYVAAHFRATEICEEFAKKIISQASK